MWCCRLSVCFKQGNKQINHENIVCVYVYVHGCVHSTVRSLSRGAVSQKPNIKQERAVHDSDKGCTRFLKGFFAGQPDQTASFDHTDCDMHNSVRTDGVFLPLLEAATVPEACKGEACKAEEAGRECLAPSPPGV